MVRACRLNVMIDPAPRLSGTAARPLSDMRRMSGRPGNRKTGRFHAAMDMRTIEKIEFGSALAVRAFLDAETARELSERFIAFDTETTGLDPDRDCIVELGAVLFEKGIPTASFQSYVNPGIHIPAEVSALNHITDEMLAAAPAEKDVYLIAGWSERIFDVLSAIDKGDDALSIINKIDV